MSKTILFAGATGVTTLPTSFLPAAGGAYLPSIQTAADALTFIVWGIGTGTWSASVTIYPVQIDLVNGTKYVTLDPVVLAISNTAPSATFSVSTAHEQFVAIVTAKTGTVSVSALMEG